MPLSEFRRPDLKICRLDGRPGTAGCIVRRKLDNQLYLLSNAHVMGWTGEPSSPGDPIFIQDDVTGGEREIARLEDWAPHEDALGSQPFDAAIARLVNQNDPAIERIGVPKACNTLIDEGMKVHMTGARSGPGHSVIQDVTFELQVRLHRHDGMDVPFKFTSLILCHPTFSDHGDSGSAVYDANGALIGLISGGCSEGSVFCRADLIFERFGLIPA